MAEAAKWYVVHTYSGYENTVKATIEKTVESRGLHDVILAVSIPLETVTEITESGVSKTFDRKVYPGYVLVKMVYSDDTWHVIRNIRGVTGFVGTSSNDPTPLTDEEVYAMGVEKKEIIVNYHVGDSGRPADLLHRHRGKHRRGQQLRQCGGFHVWPRDLRRVRARYGGGRIPVIASNFHSIAGWEG